METLYQQLLAAGVDYKPYMKLIGERPSAQKVMADRKAATAKPLLGCWMGDASGGEARKLTEARRPDLLAK